MANHANASSQESSDEHPSLPQALLVVMAGGTGGHVFPGLAVAREIQQQGWRVEWFGTADKMEAQLVPKHGFGIHFLDVKGVRGKGFISKLTSPLMLLLAVFQARKLLKALKPNAVLGMGGFASGPGGIAAWSLGIPIIIHEQNAVFGVTNKYLAKVATRVLCGFDIKSGEMASLSPSNVEFVGNPVREEFFSLAKVPRQEAYRILVVGGSLGALALNQLVPSVIQKLRQNFTIDVLHQAGKGKTEPVIEAYASNCPALSNENSRVLEFIDDIPREFANADIIICRAGALTVAEVAAAESCAIFVPLPIAVDDHQTYNAKSLSDNNAAVTIQQTNLEPELHQQLTSLLSQPEKIAEMASKAKAFCVRDATKKVSAVIVQEGREQRRGKDSPENLRKSL